MPRLVLRLYPRVLLWLLLNVAWVALGSWLVFRWQFREGMGGVLGGLLADRLHNVGRSIHEDLSSSEPANWNARLTEFSRNHQVQASLVTLPFRVAFGAQLQAPEELLEQLRRMHRELQPPHGGGPPHHAPPPHRGEGEAEAGWAGGGDFASGPLPGEMPMRLGSFMLPIGNPTLYYAGIRLPITPQWPMRQGPLFLIITSRDLTGGGLFFDLKPWLLGALGALLISALWWLPLVSGLTRSLRQILGVTSRIARGDFGSRVGRIRGDELGQLAQGVNAMAGQIQGLVAGQKRFLGDIAHELCSPMARMELGLGLLGDGLEPAQARRLLAVREELRQMSGLVDELLSFSRDNAEDSKRPLSLEPLDELLALALHTEGVDLAHVDLRLEDGLRVLCNRDLLLRALGNLIRNASKHAPGSPLLVRAQAKGDAVVVQLADQGPGVPPDALARLFEPFYRVDGSRRAETGGTGLGLAIVKSCIESFGGSVSASANEPSGLVVELVLPGA